MHPLLRAWIRFYLVWLFALYLAHSIKDTVKVHFRALRSQRILEMPRSPKHFTLNIFPFHDEEIGHHLLPTLFSPTLFPRNLYYLPQAIPTPPEPNPPQCLPKETTDWMNRIHVRKGLGRYSPSSPLAASTTLAEVLEIMVSEFGWKKEWIAAFTIFPQAVGNPVLVPGTSQYKAGKRPQMHGWALPLNLTLLDIAWFDMDARYWGQFSRASINADPKMNAFVPFDPEWAPNLELVVETKAGALQRLMGSEDFGMPMLLGEKVRKGNYLFNRLEMVLDYYSNAAGHDFVWAVARWRGARYALKYYDTVKERTGDDAKVEDAGMQEKMKELRVKMRTTKWDIEKLIALWERWVLDGDFESPVGKKEMSDEDMEVAVRRLLYQRHVIAQWGKDGRTTELRAMLRRAYNSNQRLDTIIGDPHAQQPIQPYLQNECPKDSITITNSAPVLQQSSGREGEVTLHPFAPNHIQTFELKSNVLSFGQLMLVYYSSTQDTLTGNADTRSPKMPGGTIRRHVSSYKSLARNGTWKTYPWFSNVGQDNNWAPVFDFNGPQGEGLDKYERYKKAHQGGWVVVHKSVDPGELLRRVRAIGSSSTGPGAVDNLNKHHDRYVANINRYDWSWHWNRPSNAQFEPIFDEWAERLFSWDPESGDTMPEDPWNEPETRKKELEKQDAWSRASQMAAAFPEFPDIIAKHLYTPPPPPSEIPELSFALEAVESSEDLTASLLLRTGIWYKLTEIPDLPSWFLSPAEDVEFNITSRAAALTQKFDEEVEILKNEKWDRSKVKFPTDLFIAKHSLKAGHFLAVDASSVDGDLVRGIVKQTKEIDPNDYLRVDTNGVVERVLRRDGWDLGVKVRLPNTGDEIAWLVFDGRKKVEGDEFVGIVYGANDCLAGYWHAVEMEEGLVVV
ncbi:hypothetical protein BKA65DRAFT_225968 [Rhexocercosporidium sp. MPI-PUGE-AT-0058]|nr:hypothetical protein BKA65DRAFT_225968 [Rhexocercosporidium sp. MPI-PUGE-AT-0058]